MKKFLINDVEVEFEIIDGEVFTSSLQLAEVFEKDHGEVVADIDETGSSFEISDDPAYKPGELYKQNVKWSKYIDEKGEVCDMRRISKDAFIFLLMVWELTYAAEVERVLKYLKAFNEIRDTLVRDEVDWLTSRNKELESVIKRLEK
jgi:phage regulatory protein, rha family